MSRSTCKKKKNVWPLEQAGTRWIEERESNIAKSWNSDCHKQLLRDFLRTGRPNNQPKVVSVAEM